MTPYVLGEIVSVRIGSSGYRHYGLVSGFDSEHGVLVTSNDIIRNTVTESLRDFYREGGIFRHGYPSRLPSRLVVSRLRAKLAYKYDLGNWTCEHLVADAHGLELKSTQVSRTIGSVAKAAAILGTGIVVLGGLKEYERRVA